MAQAKQHSTAAVAATVVFYLVAALAMVMANKWVLNTTAAPLFFLFTQLAIAVVLFLFCHIIGVVKVPFKFDREVLLGLTPLTILSVVGLSFNNFTLKYVDASFYQVARGLVLPFTVGTSYLFLSTRPSLLIFLACGLVTLGFFTGVFLPSSSVSSSSASGSSSYSSLLGITFGIGSSLTTALHAVVIKRALNVVNGSALDLSWYGNVLTMFVLAPIVLLGGELPAIKLLFFGPAEAPRAAGARMSDFETFMWGSLITGVIGFLMSIASMLSIKVTSPITHMVSSAVRGVAATFLGVYLFHDIITTGRASSIAIILLGSIFYTWVKHLETQRQNPQSTSKSGKEYERVPLEEVEAGNGQTTAESSEDEKDERKY
ncbi:hypothetical protein BD410DRAFT_866576 [Rickenella mellea]|uniref:Sugar phosphate transporter domain-containing protein n=1 Tax=Rickenella mellea TaxID=50990 RepID=A0A4Y7PFM3_9AGAM|nr:hypothetical protein BD410DRAFT_866576 [Rickenella mellea]